jgi:hypothetical protein
MGAFGKILSLSYDSAETVKTTALKNYYRSVRLIRDAGTVNPLADSKYTNILLCGNCVDPETRNLYVFYIDTSIYNSAWIIEFNLDSRESFVVYYDQNNEIGFDARYRIYNASVVNGRLIWTDNNKAIYQMDIARAKRSWYYKIGYGHYPDTVEWNATTNYTIEQIVSNGTYFYKNLLYANIGVEPKLGDNTKWEKLCLIEDAYYSMNVENFYFAPIPPKHPPVVVYEEDNDRKINNLRRTLFQVAYRYVYMDWRKSTFSPASIVPVPQAEEETATGLASERIALNNKLRITVNLGGEEVRAIEVIARSSDDPTKWYLIETINKFEEEERGGEISTIADAEYLTISITIQQPTVTSVSTITIASPHSIGVAVKEPTIWMTFVAASIDDMEWESDEFGLAFHLDSTITMGTASNTYLSIIPSWIKVIETVGGTELIVGGLPITDGMEIALFPRTENLGPNVTALVELTDDTVFANKCNIVVTHKSSTSIPTVGVYVHPEDASGLVISGESGDATSGSAWINITFTPSQSAYGPWVDFGLNYSISKNGNPAGSGIIGVTNHVSKTHTLTMTSDAAPADGIQVLLWEGTLLP